MSLFYGVRGIPAGVWIMTTFKPAIEGIAKIS
jgi:hypothetical protein